MERLLCLFIGGFLGFVAGVLGAVLVASILWGGYSVAWGEFAPFELWRGMVGMFGSLLGLAGLVAGGIAGTECS